VEPMVKEQPGLLEQVAAESWPQGVGVPVQLVTGGSEQPGLFAQFAGESWLQGVAMPPQLVDPQVQPLPVHADSVERLAQGVGVPTQRPVEES